MKYLHRSLALIIAAFMLSVVAANAQRLTDSATTQSLERQVEKKILKLPRYEVFDHIGFNVQGDTVTLYGKVLNAINKSDAEAAVKRVPGVTNVVNQIEILPPSGYDDSIRVGLYRRISDWGSLSRYLWTVNPSVRLIVDRGRVSLEGYVASKGDYDSIFVVAKGVSGTFEVSNNLKIDSEKAQ